MLYFFFEQVKADGDGGQIQISLTLYATSVFFLMNISVSPSLIRSLRHQVLPVILISVSSAVSVLVLILKQPVPLLPPMSTPNLTTVTLYYNLPKSEINRLQQIQIQNCLARTVVKTPKFSHITPILRSPH